MKNVFTPLLTIFIMHIQLHSGIAIPNWVKEYGSNVTSCIHNQTEAAIITVKASPYHTIASSAAAIVTAGYAKYLIESNKGLTRASIIAGSCAVLGYSLHPHFKSNAPCTYTLSGAVCGLGIYAMIDWLFPNTPQKSKMDTVDTDQTNHCKTQYIPAEQTTRREQQEDITYQTSGSTEHNQPYNDNTEFSQIPTPQQTPCQEQQEETTDQAGVDTKNNQINDTQDTPKETAQASTDQMNNTIELIPQVENKSLRFYNADYCDLDFTEFSQTPKHFQKYMNNHVFHNDDLKNISIDDVKTLYAVYMYFFFPGVKKYIENNYNDVLKRIRTNSNNKNIKKSNGKELDVLKTDCIKALKTYLMKGNNKEEFQKIHEIKEEYKQWYKKANLHSAKYTINDKNYISDINNCLYLESCSSESNTKKPCYVTPENKKIVLHKDKN